MRKEEDNERGWGDGGRRKIIQMFLMERTKKERRNKGEKRKTLMVIKCCPVS